MRTKLNSAFTPGGREGGEEKDDTSTISSCCVQGAAALGRCSSVDNFRCGLSLHPIMSSPVDSSNEPVKHDGDFTSAIPTRPIRGVSSVYIAYLMVPQWFVISGLADRCLRGTIPVTSIHGYKVYGVREVD